MMASLSYMQEIAEAMRRIVRDESEYLTLEILDVVGHQRQYIDMSQEQRNRAFHIGYENTEDLWAAGLSEGVGPDEYNDAGRPMVVMSFGPLGCSGHGTWDENLMTIHDAAGRTFDTDDPRNWIRLHALEAAGLLTQLDPPQGDVEVTTRGSYGRTEVDIAQRTVDVDVFHMTGFNRPVPNIIQLMTESRAYMVDVTPEVIDEVRLKYDDIYNTLLPFPLYREDIQQTLNLNYDPVRQERVYCFGGQNPHFVISPDAPEEYVYELVSTILANRDEFDRYVTGDVEALKEGIPLGLRPQSWFHPGAVRAFEEAGLNFGLPASIEFEKERAASWGQDYYVPEYVERQLAGEQVGPGPY